MTPTSYAPRVPPPDRTMAVLDFLSGDMKKRSYHCTMGSMKWIHRLFFVYLVLLCFFSFIGERSVVQSFRLWKEKRNLSRQIEQLEKDAASLQSEVELFKKDRKTI